MGITEQEKKDLVDYRLNKSRDVFCEAKDVAELGHWNLTVNRLYYSVFHACSALLLSRDYSARTHNGVIKMMMLEFVKNNILLQEDGELISSLFNMRHTGDYDDFFDWKEEQVKPLIAKVEMLLEKLYNLV